MSKTRLLLVEDDPLMIRFVELAVRGLTVDLVVCHGLEEARRSLAQDAFGLVVTDLNLADGSGLDLLAELPGLTQRTGRDLPTPRAVVCSGSITADVQARLQALGAWRILQKPVPVAVLARAIAEGLSGGIGDSHQPAEAAAAKPADALAQAQATAVEEFFGGDAALFATYCANFMRHLPATLAAADTAWQQQDLPALGRSAHNLKTVLRTLGDPAGAELALRAEQAATSGNMSAVHPHWAALREALQQKTL